MMRKQCKRFTKKDKQCLNRSLLGSEYCYIHWPREVWLPLIVGAIVGFILACFANYIFYTKSFKDDLINRYISLQRYIPPVISGFPVVIADGTNIQVVKKPGSFSSMIKHSPFMFFVDQDGIIEIYGEIRHPDGTLIAMVHKDQVCVIQNTGIDINSDLKAFEIVDCNENPVFQLSVIQYEQWKERKTEIENQLLKNDKRMQVEKDNMFLGANEVVQFYYIHCKGETWWCVTPEGSQRVDNRADMLEYQQKIPRLFKYPGHKYPGIRLEGN